MAIPVNVSSCSSDVNNITLDKEDARQAVDFVAHELAALHDEVKFMSDKVVVYKEMLVADELNVAYVADSILRLYEGRQVNSKKIHMIKLLRGLVSISLVEAKKAVENAMDREAMRVLKEKHDREIRQNADYVVRQQTKLGVDGLLANKIELIKQFRNETGLGLRESRDAIEAALSRAGIRCDPFPTPGQDIRISEGVGFNRGSADLLAASGQKVRAVPSISLSFAPANLAEDIPSWTVWEERKVVLNTADRKRAFDRFDELIADSEDEAHEHRTPQIADNREYEFPELEYHNMDPEKANEVVNDYLDEEQEQRVYLEDPWVNWPLDDDTVTQWYRNF